ncbi:DUF4054 domain-containing protein, partial [Escherichia coli]
SPSRYPGHYYRGYGRGVDGK